MSEVKQERKAVEVSPRDRLAIERPRGQTYSHPDQWAVYAYGVYPRSSVLAGMERRSFVDSFEGDELELAKRLYPDAEVMDGSGYSGPPNLNHLPGDDDSDPYGDNRSEADDYRDEE